MKIPGKITKFRGVHNIIIAMDVKKSIRSAQLYKHV